MLATAGNQRAYYWKRDRRPWITALRVKSYRCPFFSNWWRSSGRRKSKLKMSDRRMKFPYTFSAKIAQFPLRFYLKNQWVWRYYFISLVACSPVFIAISRLANSPANKAKWAEMKRKELAEHHH
ncbi:uncharacterized protein LOC124794837 [Schistocerca piceifrons]|uniref:uncharacterized protein LOC124794837 n=2 Tax=Schistocerca TaxID=7008 RepID=UPI001F5ED5DB|nr:uncharacterized protein LOC124794837 [Schistocerca piceifrons]XP_049961239.1 uncharacterized protein LOC126481495 [Schistocerca serialis cubense]